MINHNLTNRYYNKIKVKNNKNYGYLDWPSKKRQVKEFKILTTIINEKKFSILDYGCGMGDLIFFLKNKPYKYLGYDINHKFISFCKKKFKKKNYFFYNSPKIKKYTVDYIIASGTFSVKGKNSKYSWEKYFYNSMNYFTKISKKGFAINVHDDVCPISKQKKHIYFANLNKIRSFFQKIKNKRKIKYRIKTNRKKFIMYILCWKKND